MGNALAPDQLLQRRLSALLRRRRQYVRSSGSATNLQPVQAVGAAAP